MTKSLPRWKLRVSLAGNPDIQTIFVTNQTLVGAWKAAAEELAREHKKFRIVSIVSDDGPLEEVVTLPADCEAP